MRDVGRRPGLRGISNTIAGLIVFTFVALTLIPLILNMFVTNTQGSMRLAQSLARQVAAAQQGLNVTLDINQSQPPISRVYRVANNAASDKTVILLTIEDNNGNIYLVRPGACVGTPCSAGIATVEVTIPAGSTALPVGPNILLHPRDTVIVTVTYGKLLGLTLSGGAYVKPYVPPTAAAATVPQQVQYAAVAGSVKTNYFQLGKFNDLSQLVSSSDVALVTNPFENESNDTILWQGAIQSECVVDNHFVVGGFQPISDLNETKFDALFVTNLLPYGGSIAVGGTKPPYNTPGYGSGALFMTYGYMVYNASAPAAVIARRGTQWIAVIGIPDGTGKVYLVPMSGDTATNTLEITTMPSGLDASLTSLERYLIATITSYVQGQFDDAEDIHTLEYQGEVYYPTYLTVYESAIRPGSGYYNVAWLDTRGFGLLLYMLYPFVETINYGYFKQQSYDVYSVVVYCPPSMISGLKVYNGVLSINISGCPVVLDRFGSSNFYAGEVVNGVVNLTEFEALSDGSYISNYNVTVKVSNLTIAELYELYDAGVQSSKIPTPYRVKLNGATYMLSIYNAYTGTLNYGSNAFGFYFYADNKYIVESYRRYPEYVFIGYDLRDANLTVFEFEAGATSGIMPFMAILDTDGNGLKEIVFLGENAGFGYYYSWDGDNPLYLADIDAGCMDKTLKPLYLKFVGPQYLINGSQIAEVSMQIRYTFHDSAADDIKDVDNPKNFIMSFELITPNNTIFMSSDYIYQQLANLEDTWPPNHNWVSDSVYLLVPNKNALYTVAFAINDPYGWDSTNNDMDYALSVEWLGMWYLHR